MSTPAQLMAFETARLDEQLAAGWAVVSATVGPASEAVALMAPVADAGLPAGRDTRSGFASFALTRTHRPWRARVVVISGGSTRVIEIEELGLAHPAIQRLPDECVVIAGGRCRFKDGTAEQNAVAAGPEGSVQSKLTLGTASRTSRPRPVARSGCRTSMRACSAVTAGARERRAPLPRLRRVLPRLRGPTARGRERRTGSC